MIVVPWLWRIGRNQDRMITLPLPPSINRTYKKSATAFYKSKEAIDWEEIAGWELKRQWKEKTITGKVSLTVRWYFKRERDISSGIKILEDLLQKQRVLVNDSQVYEEHSYKNFDKQNSRVEIEVFEIK